MPGPIQVFLSGVVLGFSIAAPPGPVTAMSARQVDSRSWSSGWLVMLGATAADAIFFVLAYYGVTTLVTPGERGILFVLGGVLLLYLAVRTFRKAGRTDAGSSSSASSSSTGRSPFVMGLSMGLTNPYQLGWWVAVGSGMIADFGESVAVGFFVGILSWTVVFTTLVHEGLRRYQRLSPLISYVSATVMVGFGLWFLGVGLSTTVL